MPTPSAPVVDKLLRQICDLVGKQAVSQHLAVSQRAVEQWITGYRTAHPNIYAELAPLLERHAERCRAMAETLRDYGL